MSDQGPRRYRIANGAASPIASGPAWPVSRIARHITPLVCVVYSAVLLVFYLAASLLPVEFWPVQLILYGPRWVAGLPLILLIPLAAWLRLRWSGVALAVALISFFGIWGFNIPWQNLLGKRADTVQTLRVLTCNVQGRDLNVQSLSDFVEATRPDVVCLQECNLADPLVVLPGEGWHWKSAAEFRLASRYPISEFEELHRPDKNYRIFAVRARIEKPGKAIPFISVHLMTPRRGLQPVIERREEGLDSFRKIAGVQQLESELLLRLGSRGFRLHRACRRLQPDCRARLVPPRLVGLSRRVRLDKLGAGPHDAHAPHRAQDRSHTLWRGVAAASLRDRPRRGISPLTRRG